MFLRIGKALCAVVVFTMTIGVFVSPQQTHAQGIPVFYDLVGTLQLYTQVLSALQDSNYVENGEERALINQQLDQDASSGSTATQSSTILNRNVTLGGQDLFLAFMQHELSREWARRNAVDELARVYCEQISGRIACSTNPYYQNSDTAFVTNPIAWQNEEFTEGVLGVLMSGTDEDQQIREQRSEDRANPYLRQKPRAYSRLIAGLRERADIIDKKNNVDPANKDSITNSLEQTIAAAASQFGYQPPSIRAYDNITFKQIELDNGEKIVEPTFAKSFNPEGGKTLVSASEYINTYFQSTEDLSQLQSAIGQELQRGAEFIKAYQEYEEVNGVLATTGLVVKRYGACYDGVDNGSDGKIDEEDPDCILANALFGENPYAPEDGIIAAKYGEIEPYIKTPAQTKIALGQGLANTIGTLDANTLFAPQLGVPGQDKLVPLPGNSPGLATNGEGPSVAGIFDSTETAPSLQSLNYSSYYEQPAQNIDDPLNLNPVVPHREEGVQDALRALTGDTYRGQQIKSEVCGFCTALSDFINQSPFWQEVVKQINTEENI